jgi:CNT family concentrative nucleoside transporter
MQRFVGVLGILAILGGAYLFSTSRRSIKLKTLLWGVGMQFGLAVLVFRVGVGQRALEKAGAGVKWLLDFSYAGSAFVFGDLGVPGQLPKWWTSNLPQASKGFYFAFAVLPTIIFISVIFAILYHFGVMQFVIRQIAKVMRLMGASGAESMDVAASIFMGQTEAPLSIRPFLPQMTRSELMTVMTAGMAHVSGGIMGAYIAFGVRPEHILTSVIMTAPGTLLMAKMLVPETGHPLTAKFDTPGAQIATASAELPAPEEEEHKDENLLGAIARGTSDGLKLAINVGAMLIAFVALIYLLNGIMGGIHNYVSWFPESLNKVFGFVFAPIAWLIGVPWQHSRDVGYLLGTRMALNELIAFGQLGGMGSRLDLRTFTIATFALCGFANLSSIGIQIGGIGALAPNKRTELAKLGFRAMLAGTMANLMSAAIVGILYKG